MWIKKKHLTVILDQVTKDGVDITGFKDIEIGKMRYRMIRNTETWFTDTQGNFYGTKTHYWGKNALAAPTCSISNAVSQGTGYWLLGIFIPPVYSISNQVCGNAKEKDHHWYYHFECYKNCGLVTRSSRLEREKCVLEKPDMESASLPSYTCGGD